MAPTGQTRTQRRHSTQAFGSAAVARPASSANTPCGHTLRHRPQPMQALLSTVTRATVVVVCAPPPEAALNAAVRLDARPAGLGAGAGPVAASTRRRGRRRSARRGDGPLHESTGHKAAADQGGSLEEAGPREAGRAAGRLGPGRSGAVHHRRRPCRPHCGRDAGPGTVARPRRGRRYGASCSRSSASAAHSGAVCRPSSRHRSSRGWTASSPSRCRASWASRPSSRRPSFSAAGRGCR